MLKHLPHSGMDFLHTFLIFPGLCIPFLSSGSVLLPSGLYLFSPVSQSCFSASFYRVYSFFLKSNSIFSPRQVGFRPGRYILDQNFYLSQSISDEFDKPKPGSQTISATIDFSKAFDPVWHLAFSHKHISTGLLSCFARWTQSFLSDRRVCVVFQNHKTTFVIVKSFEKSLRFAPVEPVDVFRKDPFLTLFFSLFSSMIFRLFPLLTSAVLFMLRFWLFYLPLLRSLLLWMLHKLLSFGGSAGLNIGVFLLIRENVRLLSSQ